MEHFDLRLFTNSIDEHLLKRGIDFIVVDLSGLSEAQKAAVKANIGGLESKKVGRKSFIFLD